jgi:hypothetical protein
VPFQFPWDHKQQVYALEALQKQRHLAEARKDALIAESEQKESQRETVRGQVLETQVPGEIRDPGVSLENGRPSDEKGKGLLIREPINTATLPLFFVVIKVFIQSFAMLNS